MMLEVVKGQDDREKGFWWVRQGDLYDVVWVDDGEALGTRLNDWELETGIVLNEGHGRAYIGEVEWLEYLGTKPA